MGYGIRRRIRRRSIPTVLTCPAIGDPIALMAFKPPPNIAPGAPPGRKGRKRVTDKGYG